MTSVSGRTEGPVLAEWIQSHTIRTVSGKSFVLTEQLKIWLNARSDGRDTKTPLEIFFDAVVASAGSEDQTMLSIMPNAALVFCILLELGLGKLIVSFTRHGISDKSIPIQLQDLRNLSRVLGVSETKLAADFFEMQWRFCPAVFELDMDGEWLPEMILPICSQNLIAEGRTARVYEVSIPEDFVGTRLRQTLPSSRYEDLQSPAGWFYRLALKTFDGMHATLGKREMAAFRVLKSHDNLLRPLAAFATIESQDSGSLPGGSESRTAYSILLEYGDLDLSDYFASQSPPAIYREIERFWGNLCEVIDAIAQIHQGSQDICAGEDVVTEIIGYHHDIKPSNILFSGDKLKLSDFGFASFIPKNHEPISSSAASGTISYGPPEPNLYTVNPTIEGLQKFDLWSIGCVFSEAATWVVLGKAGIEKFQTLRRRSLDRTYNELQDDDKKEQINTGAGATYRGDYFHDGNNVLAVVNLWHELLRGISRKSDTITAKILDIVDESLLIRDIKKRVDAKTLLVQLSRAFEQSRAENDLLSPIDANLESLLMEEKV